MNRKVLLITTIFLLSFGFGIFTLKESIPQPKEHRIYEVVQQYNPYKIEKRFGGLTIVNSINKEKEKLPSTIVLKRYDELTKAWAKEHLTLKSGEILVDNRSHNIKLLNQKEELFAINFYGLKEIR